MIREYLKNNILVTDGAMGTYYAQVSGSNAPFSELANINNPDIIRQIHEQYIQAGAKLIRTNTFSANTKTLDISRDELKSILINGYEIAKNAAHDQNIFVAADIGPIPEVVKSSAEVENSNIIEEYIFIADTFLELGADVFVFETFSSVEHLEQVTEYIKQKNKNAFIIAQFVVMGDGYTRKGISAHRIIEEVRKIKDIDVYGFNCGTGPTHLYNTIKSIDFSDDVISILPNAGFPEIINERTVYPQNEEYFASVMMGIKNLGVKVIGGCCGTTPVHISRIIERLNVHNKKEEINRKKTLIEGNQKKIQGNVFREKLSSGQFTIAVELDPPFGSNIDKVISGAKVLKASGVDIITISDSPLARARINPLVVASKIKREVGVDTIPHICCRDRNIIALKADLLAAHMEGIRNVLMVTGDPIAGSEKNEIKSVFNLNSIKLMKLANEMNTEQFADDILYIGGALNLNARNKDIEILRMYKKAEAGAGFFLTQPIFEDEAITYLSNLKKDEGIKILGGIMPMVSYKNAQFLNNEIPGIVVPDKYINRFNENMTREEAEKEGIEIAVDIVNRIKNFVDGFYFIAPFNRVNMIVEIMRKIKK
ncbi:bifunctional homocysteine S-methyltransferase/methylenetetrahydrofolate reductase [Petroclostridium sp. X23]|uniref:bifunctional homocysteine S-methyltransferase/methylenetetrahydrofolate reductase n=1 Tax=Petroclostridium sp. X23 TaxID=3045146 RepID=UPI0024AE3B0D|nr:bifunctional homocysteine S-methyltransferase/methylenetetrahydrofolate reductase [Petroclostridium sp. X23]WHH57264.1 bifunctional homocysteine S-methyltransferase/methylenetetrahydrofolate reductase [Petroclostridium sp. X23]